MRICLIALVGITLITVSCDRKVISSNATDSNYEDAVYEQVENPNWVLHNRFKHFEGMVPYGISNYLRYIAISDSAMNRVMLFDTLDNSVLADVTVESPALIRVSQSTLLIPSVTQDSIFYFKGQGVPTLKNFLPMKAPSAADARRVDYWVFADKGNNRVLYQNLPEGIQLTFDSSKGEAFDFKEPSNVMFLDSLICVVDSGNKRVQIIKENGELYRSITHDGKWNYPTGISHEKDTLYISDQTRNRIDLFTVDGEYLETITEEMNGPTDINYHLGKLFIANHLDGTITVLKEID